MQRFLRIFWEGVQKMSLLHQVGARLGHQVRGLMAQCHLDAACIKATYETAAEPADPNIQADYPASAPATKDYHAFVHFVAIRSSLRQWMQVQTGDAIVGMLPADAAEVAALKGVTFLLPDGKTYQQAEAGGDLRELWEVHVGGSPLLVSFLMRLVP